MPKEDTQPDRTPYAFKIYRKPNSGERATVWFEDTEYGLAETMRTVGSLAAIVRDPDRPIVRITIELVGK